MTLFNTLTRQRRNSVPIPGLGGGENVFLRPDREQLLPTIWHRAPFIIFDLAALQLMSTAATRLRSCRTLPTIQDKVINKANDEGVGLQRHGTAIIKESITHAQGFGRHKGDLPPRATRDDGRGSSTRACASDNGPRLCCAERDVYFRTKSDPTYGKLCHSVRWKITGWCALISVGEPEGGPDGLRRLEGGQAGRACMGIPRGAGKGRPGWHLDAPRMANKYLGNTIDIHSGGTGPDLPAPRNEIAQSECAKRLRFRAILGCTTAS